MNTPPLPLQDRPPLPTPDTPGGKDEVHAFLLPPDKLRRIGIHGARGTGKTCFLACLYKHRATENLAVSFSNDQSIDHLRSAYKFLERGDVPDATALTLPTELQMGVQASGVSWSIATRDYAGALVQRSETGVPELKQEVREWLKACHAILLFINIDGRTDAHDTAIQDRHDELDLLLTELRKRPLSHDGNTVGRPLALLLTKWDVQGEVSDDLEREHQRAKEYLQSRPALKQIADALKHSAERVAVFPVSAFGSHRDGNRPPVGGPRPVGLHAPLIWALQKADEMLLERAKRQADGFAGPGMRWWSRRYGRAAMCYQQLIDQEGVNKGPLFEAARRARDYWRAKHFKRRLWQGAVVAVVLFGLLGVGLTAHDSRAYHQTLAVLGDSSATPEDVTRRCEAYLAGWNPAAGWLGHRSEVEGRWQEYRQTRETQEFTALREYRERNTAPEKSAGCVEQAKKFLDRWGGSVHAATVEGWRNEDVARADEHEAGLRVETEYGGLREGLAKLGEGKYDDAIAQCDKFLKTFPEGKYRMKLALLDDVKEKRESYEKARNEQDWAQVVVYEQQNQTKFDEIIRQAELYANKPTARYKKQAEGLIARTETRWDRTEYDKVRDAAREAKDADSFQAAEQTARRYMNSTHPKKRCEASLKAWLQWFEGFKEEKEYYIEVKSISIPADSDLAESTVTEDPRVHIELDGTKHTTGWHKGREPQIGEKLGPFRYKWGTESTLRVSVEEYDSVGSNDWAEGTAKNDRFVLLKANSTFTVTCKKGKEIPVYLECPKVVPPALPAYPEK